MKTKKWAAEFIGTFWLVLGGCGSAVLAAKFGGDGNPLGIGLVGVALAFGPGLAAEGFSTAPLGARLPLRPTTPPVTRRSDATGSWRSASPRWAGTPPKATQAGSVRASVCPTAS